MCSAKCYRLNNSIYERERTVESDHGGAAGTSEALARNGSRALVLLQLHPSHRLQHEPTRYVGFIISDQFHCRGCMS